MESVIEYRNGNGEAEEVREVACTSRDVRDESGYETRGRSWSGVPENSEVGGSRHDRDSASPLATEP